MGQRPRRLGIVLERQVAVGAEDQLAFPEAVEPEQVLGLVEAPLARGGRGREPFHRRPGHRLEGAEVRVVEQPSTLEPAHHAEDLAVLVALGADHELGGGPRRGNVTAALQPCLARQPAGQHEIREQIAREVLLSGQAPHDGVVRPFEIHRHSRGQPRRLLHLPRLGAGQELDVHVPREALAAPQDLDRREHAIHRPVRTTRHARGEEQSLRHTRAVRLHEGAGHFLGRERSPLDASATEGRTVPARQRAGIGLHHPHQRGAASAGKSHRTDPHRTLAEPPPSGQAGLLVVQRGLRQDCQTLPSVHGSLY